MTARTLRELRIPQHPLHGYGGLVRHGLQFFRGMMSVNGTAINSVSSASPDTVFSNDGSVEHNRSVGNTHKDCYIHFASPIAAYGIEVAFSDIGSMSFDLASGAVLGGAGAWLSVGISFVSSDWDPATLTWNNKPGISGGLFGGTLNRSSGNLGPPTGTATCKISNNGSHLGGIRGTNETIYGIAVSLTVGADASPIATNILGQATCKISGDEDASTIVFGSSSFGIGEPV